MGRNHQDQQKVLSVKHRSMCCLKEAVILSHFSSWPVTVIPDIALESQGVTSALRAGEHTPEGLCFFQHKVEMSAELRAQLFPVSGRAWA